MIKIILLFTLSILVIGCSQGDDKSATSDWKPSQEIIVINGHTLPPEPNPAINNAMLLGVDSNGNGVRDDVEIWIYKKYKDKHPIHIDIAMQAGRAYKQVLETPERAKEIREIVNGALYCSSYYRYSAEEFGDQKLVSGYITKLVKNQYFNTKEREEVYWKYDEILSGSVYSLPKDKDMKSFCDFSTSKYDKE